MPQHIDEFIKSVIGKKRLSISSIVSRALSPDGLNLPEGYDQMSLVVRHIKDLTDAGILESDGEILVDIRGEFHHWNNRFVRMARKFPDAVSPKKAILPIDLEDRSAGLVTCSPKEFTVLSYNSEVVIIELKSDPEGVDWAEADEPIYCEWRLDLDGTVEAVRVATEDDLRKYRVPRWIQDPEVPRCCKRPMFFVGQFDDEELVSDEPKDAEVWWHDYASFYIFTCPHCLKVKAVGQQY
jgi:hypothetical protein